MNESSNFVLKHIVKEARPVGGIQFGYILCFNSSFTAAGHHSLYGEYGMPSSHAQFMGFFATYLTLFIWIR